MSSDFQKKTLNLQGFSVYFLFFFISLIPAFVIRQTSAGEIYFNMIILANIFLLTLFFGYVVAGRLQKKDNFTNFEFPFSNKIHIDFFYYYIGILFAPLYNFIVYLILKIFNISLPKSYEIVKPFFVYATNGIAELTGQSFNIIKTTLDPFFNTYVTVMIAGVQETHIFNFLGVMSLLLIGYTVRKMLSIKDNPRSNRIFDIIFSLVVIVLLFLLAHQYNQTYLGAPILFLFAGIFLLLANVSIYWLGILLMFWVGFHESNNCGYIGYGTCVNDLFINITQPYIQIPLMLIFFGGLIFVLVKIYKDPNQFLKDIKPHIGW